MLEWRAQVSAALLYCGEGAVGSHRSAARLCGLLDYDPAGIEVLQDVEAPLRPGIHPDRVPRLHGIEGDKITGRLRGDTFTGRRQRRVQGVDEHPNRRVVSAAAEQVARHVLLPEAVRPMVKNAISDPCMAVALGTVSRRGVPTSR